MRDKFPRCFFLIPHSYFLIILLFAALSLVMTVCDNNPYFVRVMSIEGVPETGTTGTPLTITATVRPDFASNNAIEWLVRDAGTTGANINGNILYTDADGTVLLRAKIANGVAEGMDYTKDFIITFSSGVPEKVITGITIKSQPVELTYTESKRLDLYGLVVTLTFDISPPKDVEYSDFYAYKISAVPAHDSPLTMAHNGKPIVVSAGGYSANTDNLTVNPRIPEPEPVTEVTLNKTSLSLTVGGTATLTATITPYNATNKNVTWNSSNASVATVMSNGVVTAVAAGNTVITVTTADGGFTATCEVTVQSGKYMEKKDA